jgi:hypothetical protein
MAADVASLIADKLTVKSQIQLYFTQLLNLDWLAPRSNYKGHA